MRFTAIAAAAAAVTLISTAAAARPSKPLTAANKEQIAKAVKDQLKDPDSARFRWPAVQEWGLYCGWVNAKNSYGGYAGFEPFMVIGGVGSGPKADGSFLVSAVEIGGGDGIVEKMCSEHGFDMTSPPPSD